MSRLAIVCFTVFFLLGLTFLQKGNFPTVEASREIYQGNERTNERLLLARALTTYINDSFETGTYEGYTSAHITGNATMDFTQDAAHHGNYGMRCTGGILEQSYLEYEWEPTINLVYARAMVRLNTNPLNPTDLSEGLELFKIRTYEIEGYREQAATYVVSNASGQLFWTLSANRNQYRKSSATAITLGNWYCIELAFYYDAAGWAKMWIDGVILDTYNWNSTAGTEDGIHFFDLGIYGNSGTATDANVDFDCTVVADSYIEAETGVGILGDINGDGQVDMRDVGYVARLYGIDTSSPLWDPKADIVKDGKINMKDVGTVARHFGEHDPDFPTVSSAPYPVLPYVGNPVLNLSMVTDQVADYVADPFVYAENGSWYMFFELHVVGGLPQVGLATSINGLNWTYWGVVLSAAYRFAFPNVFKSNGHYYMIPETDSTNSVRLFEASDFPYGWRLVSVLLTGRAFVDPQTFYYDGEWWMFVSTVGSAPSYNSGNCSLYYADSPLGPWTEHPKSPIVLNDPSRSCGAGRPILYAGNTLLRLAQKCDKYYGEAVRVFQVDTLTKTSYAEHEISASPLLVPTGQTWSKNGMHTFNAWWNGTAWIAAVDGMADGAVWSIGIYTTKNISPTISVKLKLQPSDVQFELNLTAGTSWTAPIEVIMRRHTWTFKAWSSARTNPTKNVSRSRNLLDNLLLIAWTRALR